MRILIADAMIPEDILQEGFGVDEVGAEDLVEGGDGAAEVFGDEIGREAGGQSEPRVGEGSGRIPKGFVVTDIGNKCRVRIRDEVRFETRYGRAQLGKA